MVLILTLGMKGLHHENPIRSHATAPRPVNGGCCKGIEQANEKAGFQALCAILVNPAGQSKLQTSP